MKCKYSALHVFRVFVSVKGTDAGYSYDTAQSNADRAVEHVTSRLTDAGLHNLEITGCKDIGYRRDYIGGTLEYLIRIA